MADADPWTMLLRAPRARDAFLLRVVMGGPWSLLVADPGNGLRLMSRRGESEPL